MRQLIKVVSGGQTGVDQAALRAARDSGMEIGGWCPPGRECEAGVIPPAFPLQETEQECSPNAPNVPRSQRTEWNVRDSDGTLVIRSDAAPRDAATEGTRWTMKCAERYTRPLSVCDLDDPTAGEKIQQWIADNQISVLNVAGPSEATASGIGERAYALLRRVFEGMASE